MFRQLLALALLVSLSSESLAQVEPIADFPQARPCVEVIRLLGSPAEGEPPVLYERRVHYMYDDEGRVLLLAHDGCAEFEVYGERCLTPADGQLDQARHFEYDDAGHLVRERWDAHMDGVFEIVNSFVYDESGARVADVTDFGGDGAVERRIVYQNDERGRPTIVAFDTRDDGSYETRIVHAYDGDLETSETTDFEADGLIDLVVTYRYDEMGRLLEERSESVPPGRLSTVTHAYSGAHLERVETDGDGDGVTDIRVSWELDGESRPARQVTHITGDVYPVAESVYGYDCEEGGPPIH